MRLLLDTHLLLWATASTASGSLAKPATLSRTRPTKSHFSAASMWEITIKSALGRSDFRINVPALAAALSRNGARGAAGDGRPTRSRSTRLPAIHRDPFDRLLIAQSIAEPLVLVTNDSVLARYSESIRVV